MIPLKQREERKAVFVRARLRTDEGWSDVTIGNISSRGLMLQAPVPLRRNAFIEVRYRHVCIVGRIVWVGGARCGVRTQDKVDVAGLLSRAPAKSGPGEERRASARRAEAPRRARPAAETADASRRAARLLDWAVVAIGGGAIAVLVGQLAYSALGTPFARVGAALAGG